MVALRCVMDGTAAHLLSDRHSPFLSQLANAVWESAGLPGSPYHWAFHNRLRPRPRDQRQRRHSSSDISNPEFRCDCRPRLQDLHAMYEDVLTNTSSLLGSPLPDVARASLCLLTTTSPSASRA